MKIGKMTRRTLTLNNPTPLSKLNGDGGHHQDKYESYQPVRLYVLGQLVKVPKEVCEACAAKIVGYRWGPDEGGGIYAGNMRRGSVKTSGWQYSLKFDCAGEHFVATEEELIEWQLFTKATVPK